MKDNMIERYDTSYKFKDCRVRWFLMGILAIGLKFFSAQEPILIEHLYSNGLFQWIRKFSDVTIGRLEFPFIYIAVPLMLMRIAWEYFKTLRPGTGCFGRMANFIFTTLASVMWLVFWFTLLWGLNYNRPPIESKLELRDIPISSEYLKEELIKRGHVLEQTRASLLDDSQSISARQFPENLEDIVRNDLEKAMESIGYIPDGNVRIRHLPAGSLLRISTAGFYFPYTGEGHIDKGLHPIQVPFTMAHEMAHGYGIGDEGTCNFLAYAACRNSTNPVVRYSGQMAFWRYLAIDYQRNPKLKADYQAFRKALDSGIVKDLDEINENLSKYPDIFPRLRHTTYDAYLKAQGVDKGIDSYGEVVGLVLSWEKED